MTLADLRYRLGVDLAGAALLRLERLRSERALRGTPWSDPVFSPPLACSPQLKELISRHYLKGRYANGCRKVAWVTSGAPVEFLIALGYFVIYPENHAAVCAVRRQVEELSGHAEDAGYSRDICSYARTDFGSVLSGKTPVGRLPRPDLLLCCTNICQTVLFWYRVLADHFRVPLVVVDTPFVYDRVEEHAVAFVKRQIEDGIAVAERVAGRSLEERRLKAVGRCSKEAIELWSRVLATARQRPAPITAFDEFIHMAPVVEMRGEQPTVDYYRVLLAELEERARRGIGALKQEKLRLLWDNLPVWPRLRWMSKQLAGFGATLVASTYTNAWGELAELVDPERPLDSFARTYLQPILNRGTGDKLRVMRRMVADYAADGVLLHSDRSCKPYSVGQLDQRDLLANQLGVPALVLEADHSDPRAFSEEQVANRLAAFLEMVHA